MLVPSVDLDCDVLNRSEVEGVDNFEANAMTDKVYKATSMPHAVVSNHCVSWHITGRVGISKCLLQ